MPENARGSFSACGGVRLNLFFKDRVKKASSSETVLSLMMSREGKRMPVFKSVAET